MTATLLPVKSVGVQVSIISLLNVFNINKFGF